MKFTIEFEVESPTLDVDEDDLLDRAGVDDLGDVTDDAKIDAAEEALEELVESLGFDEIEEALSGSVSVVSVDNIEIEDEAELSIE